MKVTGSHPYTRVDKPRTDPPASPPEGGRRPSGEDAAEVRISDTAQVLRDVRSPEVPDAERIARLKAAIDNGELEVDAERIADAMLRDER
ncbi:MAG: flagellar biosynthesis anti-sigma factor FlgM [Sandaracinaceae bacterium]